MCTSLDNRAVLRALTAQLYHNLARFDSFNAAGTVHLQYYRTACVYHRMISDYFNRPDNHDRACDACAAAHTAYDLFQSVIDTIDSTPTLL